MEGGFLLAMEGISLFEMQIDTGIAFLIRCGLKKMNETPRVGNVPE